MNIWQCNGCPRDVAGCLAKVSEIIIPNHCMYGFTPTNDINSNGDCHWRLCNGPVSEPVIKVMACHACNHACTLGLFLTRRGYKLRNGGDYIDPRFCPVNRQVLGAEVTRVIPDRNRKNGGNPFGGTDS